MKPARSLTFSTASVGAGAAAASAARATPASRAAPARVRAVMVVLPGRTTGEATRSAYRRRRPGTNGFRRGNLAFAEKRRPVTLPPRRRAHGRKRFPAGGIGPRLADGDARRREMPGGRLPPLAARPAVHPAAPQGQRLRRHRGPRPRDEPAATPARRPPLLPLPAPGAAAGRGGVAAAALRPGGELQPLRRQGRPPAAGRAARLLLLHADALRLAHARSLLRRPGPRREGPPGGPAAEDAARLGPAHGHAGDALPGHQRGGAPPHRRVLRPRQHGDLPAG